MMYRNLYIAIIIFLGVVRCEAAGRDSVQFARFNIENGLPSNHVYSTVEDSKGYIWFLTNKGIVKYNGYNFTTFNTSNGLPSDDVWYLTEDARDRLWLHTYSKDIGYIKNDQFHKLDFPHSNTTNTIKKVYVHNGQTVLWVGGDREFLYSVDSADKVKAFKLPYMLVLKVFPDLLGQRERKFVKYRYTHRGLQEVGTCKGVADTGYFFMTDLTSVNTSISTSFSSDDRAKELLLFDEINCSRKIIEIGSLGASEDEKVYLVYVKDDLFFIITNRSVITLDKYFKLRGRFVYSGIVPESHQLTHQEFVPRSGKWLSTKEGGCLQLYEHPQKIYPSAMSTRLENYTYAGMSADGTVWWYNEAGLKLVGSRGDGKVFRQFDLPDKLISFGQALDGKPLACLPDNVLKIDFEAGESRYFFDVSKPVFVGHPQNTSERKTVGQRNAFKGIQRDRKWQAWWRIVRFHEKEPGNYYYISRIGLKHLRFDGKAYYEQLLDNGKYDDLLFDKSNNRYWVYSSNSILLLDPEKDSFRIINAKAIERLGVSSISQIVMDSFSNMYVYDRKRILMINTRSLAYRYLPVNVNLSDAKLTVVGGTVTITGKFGVAQARILGPLALSAFALVPNIRSQYYNIAYGSAVVAKDSLILVSTDKGVFKTRHPVSSASQTVSGHIVLAQPFQKRLGSGDTIRFDASTNQVAFDYINYYGKGNRLISYKVSGTPWKESSLGEMSVADLQPGIAYELKCKVKDEMLESRLYTFYVYKVPFWYQTSTWRTIFWIAGILLFLATILVAILVTKRIIARANTKRSLQIELELRAIHSQINPHFIFNTLSSVQYFISKKNFEEAYVHVNKFSRLLRLYLQSSRNRYTVLAEEVEMLSKYIDLQKTRFEGKFEYSIEIDKKIPADSIQIPSLLLQPLVENAINHGLFHRGQGGLLQIRFEQGSSNDELFCYIEDNGVGRVKSKALRNESEVYRNSYGTKLTEELIDLFEKYEKMNIAIEYIDKNEPETGTIVKLILRNMKYAV